MHLQKKSFVTKINFKRAKNCIKRVLEAAKIICANETKESIISQKASTCNFWQITSSVFQESKFAISSQFNGPEMFFSESDKGNLFTEPISKNFNLGD